MHSAVLLRVSYRDLRVLFLAFRGFALRGFNRDFVVLISRNKADASATVEQPFNANIIGINKAFSDRDKLEMNSSRCFFFSFALCQWFIASSAFQLGSLPGILSISVCIDL